MKIEAVRASDGSVFSLKRKAGCDDVYTTLLVSGNSWELRGFTYSIGAPVTGGMATATQADTNLPYDGWKEPVVWLGMEWGLPLVSPARFQVDPALGDYALMPSDITEFVGKAYIALYARSGDKPYVAYPAAAADVRRSEARIYQQVTFQTPLEHRPDDRLWVALSWPAERPKFGTHPMSSKPGVLTVIIKLLAQLPQREETPPTRLVVPVAPSPPPLPVDGLTEIAGTMREMRDLLREQGRAVLELSRTLAQTRQQEPEPRRDLSSAEQRFAGYGYSRGGDGPESPPEKEPEQENTTSVPEAEAQIDEKRFRSLEGGKKK